MTKHAEILHELVYLNCFKFHNFQKVSKACSEDTCKNGGICRETSRKNYECECNEEFTGRNCECKWPFIKIIMTIKMFFIFLNKKVSPSLCQTKLCLNGGTCFYSMNSNTITCHCKQGWNGTRCETNLIQPENCKIFY